MADDSPTSDIPTPPDASTRYAIGWLSAIVAALLLVAALSRFSYIGQRFANDPGLYAAMGKAVVEGRQLYVEIWDTKLPGITLLTAPLYALFRDRWWAWIASQFVMMIVGVAALADAAARVARVRGDARGARLATWAVGLTLSNVHWLLVTGFQLETPMLVASSIGAWATIRAIAEPRVRPAIAWAIVAGVGGGLAATLKPTALAVCGAGAIAVLAVARREGVARPARLAAGLFVGLAAMLLVNVAWYAYLNAWPYLPDVAREISLYGSGTPWTQMLTPKTVMILGLLAWPALVVGCAAALARRGVVDRAAVPDSGGTRVAAFAFASTWMAMEVVGTILQKRGYAYHFLPIAAPATLLAGLLVAGVGRRAARSLPLAVAIAVMPAALHSLATSAVLWRGVLSGRSMYPAKLIEYVRANTRPGDAIFADPVGELAVMTDRRPGSRVGMLISFVNHDGAPEKFSALVVDDLEQRQCELVLLPIPEVLDDRIRGWERQPVLRDHPARRDAYRLAWQRVIRYVHAHYAREGPSIDGREIWRRSPAPTTRP